MGLEYLLLGCLTHMPGKVVLVDRKPVSRQVTLCLWDTLEDLHSVAASFPQNLIQKTGESCNVLIHDLILPCHFHNILLVTHITLFSAGGEHTGTWKTVHKNRWSPFSRLATMLTKAREEPVFPK